MKDNKYAPYILGPVLLLIWGLIFYKIYQAVYGEVSELKVSNYGALPVFETVHRDSSYTLLVDYKDPFLGKRFAYTTEKQLPAMTASVRSSNTRRTVVPATPIKPTTVAFPSIVYQGYQIMAMDTVALLRINKQFYPIAHQGDVLQSVRVGKIYGDSVEVFFEGLPRTFLKKK